jgi:lysophospholipase L1-like esterase
MSWKRYVAIGDSFTEGIGDPGPDGRDRGWADRVARSLSQQQAEFAYANLAVRGRKVAEIMQEQVPAAVALQPDLVSFAGGINDALRRNWDLTGLAQHLEAGVSALADSGAQVVIVTYGRPSNRSRVLGRVEQRLADYRDVTYEIAERQGAYVVDFWDAHVLNDPRFWSDDRLHLNPVGHQRVAMAVLEMLGVAQATSWLDPLPPVQPPTVAARAARNTVWAGKHLVPWLGRRAMGRSSGDGVTAKRPECLPV